MTYNDIKKALELCATLDSGNCKKCPCREICNEDDGTLTKLTLDLINRQKAEIERLQMDNKQLQSDVINANQNWEHIKELWECEKEKVETAKQIAVNVLVKRSKTTKSEAIKEFADSVKQELRFYYHNQENVRVRSIINHIDNLVKEMTEVQK